MEEKQEPISKQKERESKSSKSSSEKKATDKNQIAIIRISGMVKVNKNIEEALYRLKLRRKYACVVVKPTKEILGMIKKVRYHVSYGEITKDVYDKLVKERGKKNKEGKLKPFFRLHPPRKGIKSKLQATEGGVLGKNNNINKLIERML